jgi:hypothetical protein
MPLIRNVISGAGTLASAKVARQWNLTAAPGGGITPAQMELQVNTLPFCVWYVIMNAGPPNCTFQPLSAVTNTVALGVVRPDYHPMTPPQPVFLGVPLLLNQRISANMISVQFLVPGGGAAAQCEFVLAASM